MDEKAQQAPPMFTAQIVLHSRICFHGTSLTFMDCKKLFEFYNRFVIRDIINCIVNLFKYSIYSSIWIGCLK